MRLNGLVKRGHEAQDVFVIANLRLVVSVSKHYWHRGLDELDVIQEGNLGLMRALESYDVSKGFKFSTYATWWIRQTTGRAVYNDARTVRLPVHVVEKLNSIRKVRQSYIRQFGREATTDELAGALNMDKRKLGELIRYELSDTSLDMPVSEDEDSTLGEFIPAAESYLMDDALMHSAVQQHIKDSLSSLEPRAQDVITLHYGLDGGECETLEEIGHKYGLTRERIRQIVSKSMDKLRLGKKGRVLYEDYSVLTAAEFFGLPEVKVL